MDFPCACVRVYVYVSFAIESFFLIRISISHELRVALTQINYLLLIKEEITYRYVGSNVSVHVIYRTCILCL